MKTASLVIVAFLLPALPAAAQTNTHSSAASFAPPGAGLMGQPVYNDKGQMIGTVTAITSDIHGQQLAGVRTEPGQGASGTVLFPSNTLKPRPGGGFTTSLSANEIKALPKPQTPAR